CTPTAANLSLFPLRCTLAVPLPQQWSPGQPTALQSLWSLVSTGSPPSSHPPYSLLVPLLPERPLLLETTSRLYPLQMPLRSLPSLPAEATSLKVEREAAP